MSTVNYEKYIGQKINLIANNNYYTVDPIDPIVCQIKNLEKDRLIRFKTPGMCYTMDYREERVNISVNKTGEITSVKYG